MRLNIPKSPAIITDKYVYFTILQKYIGRSRRASAATVQLSVRSAAKLHRHPHCAPGSITHCLQWRCSGSSVCRRLCSGDSVPDSLLAGDRNVIFERFGNDSSNISASRTPSGLQFVHITRQTKPKPWM